MKVKQFQCVLAVVENGYSVTAAADKLFMSQPAVSKQIKLFEDMLGKPVFRRQSRQFTGLTELGEVIVPEIKQIVQGIDRIRALAQQPKDGSLSPLSIVTTNTLATYRLAPILTAMRTRYPQMPMNVIEGTNAQILQMVQEYEADYGWFSATDLAPYATALRGLAILEAVPWSPILVVPRDHLFTRRPFRHLHDLAEYPLITYVTSHKGLSGLAAAMAQQGCHANVVLTARNADLIKNYVRQGIGLGVIAEMAYDAARDSDLVQYDLSAWIPAFQTYLVWQLQRHLRSYDYDFIHTLIPSADRRSVRELLAQQQMQEGAMWMI